MKSLTWILNFWIRTKLRDKQGGGLPMCVQDDKTKWSECVMWPKRKNLWEVRLVRGNLRENEWENYKEWCGVILLFVIYCIIIYYLVRERVCVCESTDEKIYWEKWLKMIDSVQREMVYAVANEFLICLCWLF